MNAIFFTKNYIYKAFKKNGFFDRSIQYNNDEKFKGSQNPASKEIYVEIITLIEKLNRFIHFVMVNLTLPCLLFPKYTVCYYTYFTTDIGNDAFELPLPVW